MSASLLEGTYDPRTVNRETTFRTSLWPPEEDENNYAQSSLGELANQVATLTERPIKWTTQIRDLGEEEYLLTEPIQIVIEEYSDGSVIARFPEVEVFGEGNNEPIAIVDLKNAILDLYDELSETAPSTLGDTPKMWLRILTRIINKT